MKLYRPVTVFVAFVLIINFCVAFIIPVEGIDNVYFENANDEMKIALTFDDGPHPRYTPQILDILDEYGIKATFFVIGVNARDYPKTLEMVVDAGHEIANHTYTHLHLSEQNMDRLCSEIEMCEQEIFSRTDIKTKLFRPPEGFIRDEVGRIAKSLDYSVILWDLDTRDWDHTPPDVIAQNVMSNIKSGDIILMHDFIGRRSPTPEALRIFIPKLLERGYKFVVVSELIGIK